MRRLQKFGSILLVLALCLTMLPVTAGAEEPEAADGWDSSADTGWYEEGGSEFTISTAEQLAGLAQLVNRETDFSGKTITLTADINLAGREWTPIGTGWVDFSRRITFNGTFDGGGRTISGLYINKDVTSDTGSVYLGLFGYVGEGTVKQLTVTGSVIGCDNRSGTFDYYYAGGIVGACGGGGDIVNCMADVTVTGNSNRTRTAVGGIVGKKTRDLVCSGTVGGVVGSNYYELPSTVSNCYYLTDGESEDAGTGAGKTQAQFASGEVAWELQGEQTSQVWGQTLGVGGDRSPVLLCFDPTATPVFKAAFLNGNEEFAAGYINSGGTVNLPGGVPTGNGAFLGWFDAETGGTEVTGPITVTGNATYYARFGTTPEPEPTPPTQPSQPSGGSDSEPSYSPVLDVGNGGTVRVNPRTPGAGDGVTITVEPDQGYEVDAVTVTDQSGDPVAVTDNRDGTYRFTQPRGRVTIRVTFREIKTDLPFADVPADYWAYDAIAWALENGYMNGTSASTFSPNAPISRQQVWMILSRLSGADPANMTEARTWAMGNGISDGTSPGGAVTRQQLAALLYRYARLMGYDTTQGGMAIWEFPDCGQISSYAVEAVDWAVNAGVIQGTADGTLNPGGTATRAQFAVMLTRFCRLDK